MIFFLKKNIKRLINIFERKNKEFHQLKNSTSYNRYPEIFSFAQKTIKKNNSEIKILSFGCSTGEECFSLHDYFPNARIVGVDINTKNLRQCDKKNIHKEIIFLLSNENNITSNGPYDIIFAMSVLCSWPATKGLKNINKIYPFHKYENITTMLSDNLSAEGLLVIFNSNYLFEETTVGCEYERIVIHIEKDKEIVHKYKKDGARIETFNDNEIILYRKPKL
jgi:hypothetical protein